MATWTQRSIGSQVIDSLTAGKITTGTLQAGTTINVGDPAGVHTAIGQGAVRIMRPDSDGVVTPVITMGGATRDVVQIVDPDTGATVAGLGDDGSVVGQEVIADSLTVGGAKIGNPYDPEDLLWLFARGTVGFEPSAATDAAGNTRYGVIEASAQVQGGRLYRVSFYGTLHQRNDGSNQTSYITFFRTLDGSAPSINSAVLHSGSIIFPILGNVTLLTPAMAYIDVGADPGLWYTLRVLVTIHRAGTNGTVAVLNNAATKPSLTIEDCGPQGQAYLSQGKVSGGGGTPAGSSTVVPPPAVESRDYVRTYNATWGRTWRESGSVRTDIGPDLIQGRASSSGATNNYAMCGFPSQVYTDLQGATVSKIEVYLYASHWWNQAGTAVIGTHGNVSFPSSFSYSGQFFSANWKRGEGRWVTLPREWYAGFKSGANRGITLGGNVGTSNVYYGKFYGYATSRGPKLRVSYTK